MKLNNKLVGDKYVNSFIQSFKVNEYIIEIILRKNRLSDIRFILLF